MSTETSSIREQLILIAELQQADIKIVELEKELSNVQQRLDDFEKELATMAAVVEESSATLYELKRQYRNDESEVRSVEDTIAKTQAKLNSVKTNKEYQAMLKAVDDLKHKSSDLQDKVLASLDQIEAAEKRTVSAKADQEDLIAEIQEKKNSVMANAEGQKEKINRLQKERHATFEQLPPKWQSVYARASKQGRGIGVAAVHEAVCQACRVNLPPQTFIDLMRMNTMLLCPNCQRIMYPTTIWDTPKKTERADGTLQGTQVRSE